MDRTTTPYAIHVSGRLGPTTLAAFPELVGEDHGSETILAGNVSDASALYGIIARLEALGLELIEVRPLARNARSLEIKSGRPGDDPTRIRVADESNRP